MEIVFITLKGDTINLFLGKIQLTFEITNECQKIMLIKSKEIIFLWKVFFKK